jgi:hypothetical protein
VNKELEGLFVRYTLKKKKKDVEASTGKNCGYNSDSSSEYTNVKKFVRKRGPVLKKWKPIPQQLEGGDSQDQGITFWTY